MFTLRLSLATLSLFVLGCTPPPAVQKELGRQAVAAQKQLGGQTVVVLSKADRVEVFRLDGLTKGVRSTQPALDNLKLSGFPVIARGHEQGADFASKLASAVTDQRNYSGTTVGCFWPGVGFRVWKGAESVDVLICFKCGNFYCGPPTDHAEQKGAFCNQPAVQAAFVKLAKEAFPDDKEIQELRE